MSRTIHDIIDLLKRQDCVTILELLDINEDELVNMFLDKVEERMDYIEQQLYE
jgi:hypothetical protein